MTQYSRVTLLRNAALQLKQAIDANDLPAVIALMTSDPSLHRAPLGYGKDGPLTWVAECRVPWEPPTHARLDIARWMLENGSDVHQGGDGPLMRATLVSDRRPMMDLLFAHGANVNALWHDRFPIIFAPCETLDSAAIQWLLDRGANPDCGERGTALDYVIATYSRSPADLSACIEILLHAGATTRYNSPPLLTMLRGRMTDFSALLDSEPSLVARHFAEFDFGNTAFRCLKLRGATLLHVAAEYGLVEAARLLLDRGADPNAPATISVDGVGGQTPIFHAASQFDDKGLPLVQLLLARGADLTVRAKLPGHYERPDEVVECTPLSYSLLFPGADSQTVALLRSLAAPV